MFKVKEQEVKALHHSSFLFGLWEPSMGDSHMLRTSMADQRSNVKARTDCVTSVNKVVHQLRSIISLLWLL
jgi:hypothetical protein